MAGRPGPRPGRPAWCASPQAMRNRPAVCAPLLPRDVGADSGRAGGLATEVDQGDVVTARYVVAAQDGSLRAERLVEDAGGFPAWEQLGVLEILHRHGRGHVPSVKLRI